MNTARCPDNAVLSEYSVGALSTEQSALIEQHLNGCSECSGRLESLEQLTDPFITMLRNAGSPVSQKYLYEPEYQAAVRTISHLKILTEQTSAGNSGDGKSGQLNTAEPTVVTESLPGLPGHYELREIIGRGGIGVVYLAFDQLHNRDVVIKILKARAQNHPKMLRRFEAEMRLAGQLNHPNVMRAIDAGQNDGRQYLVFEHCDGRDVSMILKHAGLLRIADACEIVHQSAAGLQHIYENGLVHRDLKPANLFLTRPGQVRILDLGLALLRDTAEITGAGLTSPGKLMGTIDYMSPEQAEDTHQVDIRADIYSLGATLYALLCGNTPLRGTPDSSLMERLLSLSTGEFTPVDAMRPEVPAELADIVHRMLARRPADRYQTPIEVASALEPWCRNAALQKLAAQFGSESLQ